MGCTTIGFLGEMFVVAIVCTITCTFPVITAVLICEILSWLEDKI